MRNRSSLLVRRIKEQSIVMCSGKMQFRHIFMRAGGKV
ncbi:hypothetical protein DA2_3517 [Desulfovibrio sp. A2]|nr:hypothetical protein DA2_3517 [Desulfovibrio sp. A2]